MTSKPVVPMKRKAITDEELQRRQVQRSWCRRGGLESLPNMPLDVLMEIISHMMPMDLLSLARTSRNFRSFLMARSAAPLWRAARMNIERLPDCPDDLSEPAYANLAFDAHCSECGRPNIKTTLWALRVRFCPSCRKTELTRCANHRASQFTESCDDMILPYSSDGTVKAHWHLTSDIVRMTEVFDTMDKEAIAEQQKKVKAIMEHAVDCEVWQEFEAFGRTEELEKMKANRLAAIVQKLSDMGWEDELALMAPSYEELQSYSDVNKPKELTERAWNNMKQKMNRRMERIVQLQRNTVVHNSILFLQMYREWHAKQTDKRALPRAAYFMHRPEVRTLVSMPLMDIITTDNFLHYREHLSDWAAGWRRDCEDKLRECIRKSDAFKDKIPADVDPLTLASVAFSCEKCENNIMKTVRMPSLYPSLISHDCLWKRVDYHDIKNLVERWMLSTQDDTELSYCDTWTCEPLFIGKWHYRMVEVIQAAGKDPYKTTLEEMDQLDVRFWCDHCCSKLVDKRIRIYKWRDTLSHHLFHDEVVDEIEESANPACERKSLKWHAMSGAVIEKVKEIEKRTDKVWDRRYQARPYYFCGRCPAGQLSYDGMQDHLYFEHNIDATDSQHHSYITPDSDISRTRPVLLIKPTKTAGNLHEEEQSLYEEGPGELCDYTV